MKNNTPIHGIVSSRRKTHAHQVIRYTDGTVRQDFKAEALNTYVGAARPRGEDDEVGEPYEPDKSREAGHHIH
jgi:hypothetical protein